MGMKKRVCICGGGNLGHVVAGFLAAHGTEVSLLTRHPQRWQQQLHITTPDGEDLVGTLLHISNQPELVIPQADIVLLCLPGFSIREELLRIRPFLQPRTAVGSIVGSTGFFFEAFDLLPSATILFGFQRVPFIARTIEYGRSAALLGYKPVLHMAVERIPLSSSDSTPPKEREQATGESLRSTIEQLFATPTVLLGSHYEVSLTNSNPLLHTSRLYSLWHDWHEGMTYPVQTKFYEEWTDDASQLLIDMDGEFFQLLDRLPVRPGSIPTILDYYESTDASSLTRKLRSIQAFKGILAPMTPLSPPDTLGEERFIPDFTSRYFSEDFPFGLRIISQQAQQHHVATPVIDKVLAWGLSKLLPSG
jgi:hypothetical protein